MLQCLNILMLAALSQFSYFISVLLITESGPWHPEGSSTAISSKKTQEACSRNSCYLYYQQKKLISLLLPVFISISSILSAASSPHQPLFVLFATQTACHCMQEAAVHCPLTDMIRHFFQYVILDFLLRLPQPQTSRRQRACS